MNLSDYERMELSSEEDRRLLRQEELIIEVTEAIAEAMERTGITQKDLAERLNCTKGYVSQLLGGGRNLTLRTLSDVALALESDVRVELTSRTIFRDALVGQPYSCANDNAWRIHGPSHVEDIYEVAA